jgi:hypothetical protein
LLAILVVAIIFFGVCFGKEETKASKALSASDVNEPGEVNRPSDVNMAGDANAAPTEPNNMEKELEKIRKEIEKLERAGQRETEEMARNRMQDRLKAIESMKQRMSDELNFIRDIAIGEGAQKTAAAIELMIEKQNERYDQMIERIRQRAEQEVTREGREERERKPPVRDRRERDRRK